MKFNIEIEGSYTLSDDDIKIDGYDNLTENDVIEKETNYVKSMFEEIAFNSNLKIQITPFIEEKK